MRKDYGGLRPLRLAALAVGPAERVAITGLDAPSAEILVNILTGATLPDEGEVHLFGRATSSISDADDWLATLDRIGMVSPRALLAEDLTVAQGIAMAFTLSLDAIPEAVAADVTRLASDAGLADADLGMRLSDASASVKARCRLARALATAPAVLVLEHANALVPGNAPGFGRDIAALAKAREHGRDSLDGRRDVRERGCRASLRPRRGDGATAGPRRVAALVRGHPGAEAPGLRLNGGRGFQPRRAGGPV